MGMLLDISEPFDLRHIFPSSTAEKKDFLYWILVNGEDWKYIYASPLKWENLHKF